MYRYYKQKCREWFDGWTNIAQAKAVNKGDTVTVIRGRRVPKGTMAKVFWVGTRYNPYAYREEDRVGVEFDGRKEFLPLEYVEIADWESRLLHGKERKRAIAALAVKKMPCRFRDQLMRQ